MSRPVIFLDIDGPMIPTRSYYLKDNQGTYDVFDPCAVVMLNRLIKESKAQLVISSVHARQGWAHINSILTKNGIDPVVVHLDWCTHQTGHTSRTQEILDWLDNHHTVKVWVAIDDETLSSKVLPNFVQCSPHDGFLWRNYLECRYMLMLDNPQSGLNDQHNRPMLKSLVNQYRRLDMLKLVPVDDPRHARIEQLANVLFPIVEIPENEDEGY